MSTKMDSPEEWSTETPSERMRFLYDQHGDKLRLYLLGILRDRTQVDDVLQQVFGKLQEQLCRQDQEITAGWLFRVAYHEAIQLRRSQSRSQKHASGIAWYQQQCRAENSDPLIDQEDVEKLRQALQHLPEELKEIVRLRMYEDLKFREIAEQLQLPQGTVLTRMSRALELLKQSFQKKSAPNKR